MSQSAENKIFAMSQSAENKIFAMSRPSETSSPLHLPRMKTCCCCINLKAGVVIISILWLVFGLYEAIADIMAYRSTDTNNFYSYIYTFTLITGIMALFTVIGALYGLIVVSFAKITQTYVIIAWLIAARYIINSIAEIILLLSLKDSFLSYCDLDGYSEDTCLSTYNNVLLIAIIEDILIIIISIYFATVVAAYRAHRVEKDKASGLAEVH
ncbi:11087_t:CDS:2 [Ambispora leptoticha]|uniref:11087_t:CDS:1 n=1 Tax=Ambispora leptoticha TaxID=144679 RepID=A0A9N9AH06_9GLOM|nr:11087_t:CDS:2 [Ambispora leptoticha]